jgi:NAD(P)-dependent dehydrogenase (short-subunit alcohol dehydrogenase family)
VITGANSGIGLQSSLSLAKSKAKVVLACRR